MMSVDQALQQIPAYREVMHEYTCNPEARKPSYFIRKGWCQHEYARDKDGNWCDATNPEAVAWCLGGAVQKAGGAPVESFLLQGVIRQLIWKNFQTTFMAWNDHRDRTQDEVIAFLEYYGL